MPAKQPHDHPPAQRCKHRPRRPRCPLLPRPARQDDPADAAAPLLLHRQLRQREDDAGEDVGDDLLVDGGLDAAAEDGVAADQAGEEGVVRGFVAGGAGFLVEGEAEGEGGVAEGVHEGFVEEGEEGEVAGVGGGCFEDEEEFLAEAGGLGRGAEGLVGLGGFCCRCR